MTPSTLLKSIALVFITTVLFFQQSFSQTSIFGYTVSWSYLNPSSNPSLPVGWTAVGYSEAGWTTGSNAQFHVGESGSTNLGTANTTIYFRKTISMVNPSATYATFDLTLVRDDGAIVYVNGTEVYRTNMPAGAVSYTTSASSNINGGPENDEYVINVPASSFVNGNNTIAVEVHQNNASDMRFQLKMDGNLIPAVTIDRGPYIQVVNETEATLRWRTNTTSNSRVQVGTTQGVYTTITDDAASVTQHIVRVTGLSPDTKYYYSVGTTANPTLGGNAVDYYFTTAAPQNTTRKLKFAVFGDCGRNDNSFRTQTIAAYQSYVGTNTADALLLLGDNAYNSGTEPEYNTGFFTPMSNTMLKNHPLFPAPGNHDYYGTSQSVRTGEYYQSFSMPTAAECGGVASTTKAYYSWNWGDVHFLSLDSYGTETAGNLRLYDTLGPQVTWIKNDMAANTRKWTVAYWHHPPYTMGSHTSNSETELINIRFNFIRILERLGVDLILCGHSHDYERSKLMNGHYGTEIATASMTPYLVSNSSAKYDGSASSCPYTTASNTQNHGTVYVVAGSSGADGSVLAGLDGYPHNAMPHSIDDGGMFYFEVEGNRLDAKFLRQNNTIGDQFTIVKDVNKTTNYSIVNGQSQTLTASWPGNHAWSTSATTKSISVTPPNNATTNYTVTDNFGCITDQFAVTTSGTLPVIMKNYTVNLRSDKTYIDWATTSEVDNHHFTIERSANARQFENIGIVNGAGNSSAELSYNFIDPLPLEGVSYYRLSQTNIDGAAKYFDIKRIVNNKANSFYADAYQSGAQTVAMQLYAAKNEKIYFSVIDFSGRMVKNEVWNVNAGSNNKSVELKNGSYILKWKKDNGVALSQKIIVK